MTIFLTCLVPTKVGVGPNVAIGGGPFVGVGETGFWVGIGDGVGVGIASTVALTRASTVASIFGVGIGLGNEAATIAVIVASISIVGTGGGARVGVVIGNWVVQASPVKARPNNAKLKTSGFIACPESVSLATLGHTNNFASP